MLWRNRNDWMDRVYGIIFFGLGIAILWQGRDLSIGSLRSPGSGLFPALIAVIMLVLSSFLIIVPQKGEKEGQSGLMKSFVRICVVFLAMVLYSFFLEYLGFLIVSFLLTTLLFAAFGSQSYWRAILRAVVFTGFAYTIFEVLFKSNLPKGIFGF